jgi:O-antigen/teichoic acid export membrane protein
MSTLWLSTSKLAGGTAVAQGMAILTAVFVARTFSPHVIGSAAIVVAVSAMLGMVATGRYELAVLVARSERSAAALCGLALILSSAVLVPTFLVLLLLVFVTAGRVGPEWPAGALLASLTAWSQIQIAHANRLGRFATMSYSRIFQASSALIATVLVAQITRSVLGLVGAAIVAALVSNAFLHLSAPRRVTGGSARDWKLYRILFWSYIRFPKYALASDLLNSASYNMPLLLMGAFFGPAATGAFSMAQRVLLAPVNILSNALQEAFKRELRQGMTTGQAANVYARTFRVLLVLAVPFALLGVAAAPTMFRLALGPGWARAGEYAAILTPMFAAKFLSSPLSYVLIAYERLKLDSTLHVGWIVCTTSAFVVCGAFSNDLVAIATYSVLNTAVYVTYIVISRRIAIAQTSRIRL